MDAVNWYDKLVPGRTTIRIPLQIFVGERIQLHEQRALDPAQMTRLLLSFSETGHYRLSDMRLEEEVFRCSRPDWLHALDFGPNGSPLMHGFESITPESNYNACRGYGMKNANIWRKEDRRHPDALYRDWISFNGIGGDFVLDLPAGEYQVEIAWEDAGYWEYYQRYDERRVLAEGLEACHQTQSYSDYLARYYRFEQHEDVPSQDTWDTYINWRYKPTCIFTTNVTDGQLNLDFIALDPYAASVNALIVYPTSRTTEAQSWLAELDDVRKRDFSYDHRRIDLAGLQPDPAALFPTSPLELGGTEGGHEWAIFQRDPMEQIFLNSVPENSELISQLSSTIAKDERTPVTFALYPQVDLGTLNSLTVEGLPADVTVDAHYVFSMDRRLNSDGIVHASQPHLLKPITSPSLSLDLPANRSRRFWLGVTATDEATEGQYNATVRLETSTGKVITLPLSLTILPVTLPAAPVRHSLLGSMSLYPLIWQLEEKTWDELPDMLKMLKQYGMSAVTGPYLATWNGSYCNTANAERYLTELKKHDFAPLINSYFGKGIPDLHHYFESGKITDARAAINCSIDRP